MNSKPLTYDSLKTVLYHLDPNMRFLISIRIPSLRVTERLVPLKIDKLCFGNMLSEINKTRYSLGVCLEGCDVLFSSSFNKDLDEYGELDEISGRTVLPGDVVFKPLDPHPIPPVMTEERMNALIGEYENILRNERVRLALLESLAQDNFVETFESFNHSYIDTFLHETEAQMRALGNSPEVEKARRYAANVIGCRIKRNVHSLQILLNRRDNVRPNFEIQLKITSPSGVRTERVKYTAKLHSAEKSLLKMMLGNRKHVVQVKKLVIYQYVSIRFPLGLKMKIRELFSIGNIRCFVSAFNAIVDSSSYPLERLEIRYDSEDSQDMGHEVVQNAKSLAVSLGVRNPPMLPVFLSLQNEKVHAKDYDTMTTEEHVKLIKRWLEVGKPNGTCFTFEMRSEEKRKVILEMVEQQCDRAVMEDKCVVIPMNASLVLKLSNELVLKETYKFWMFKMEVLSPGPASI